MITGVMVNLDKGLGDNPEPNHLSDPQVPGELQAALQVFSIVPRHSQLTHILHLIGVSADASARAQRIRLRDVERQLRQARAALLQEALDWIDVALGIHNKAVPPDIEKNLPLFRRAIELAPAECLEVYRRYRADEPVKRIAKSVGIPLSEVRRRVEVARAHMLSRVLLAVRRLMEIGLDSDDPVAEYICQAYDIKQTADKRASKKDARPMLVPFDRISEEEQAAAGKVFYSLGASSRDLFALDAIEIGLEEIATLFGRRPPIVYYRLQKAQRAFAGRFERLIIAYLQNRTNQPHAPQMTPTERTAAETIYNSLSERSRRFFEMFMGTGDSAAEIAQKTGQTVAEVERRIKSAKKYVRARALTAGILAVRNGEDLFTATLRLLPEIRSNQARRRKRQGKREQQRVSNLPPLDRLTESERTEAERLFEALDERCREIYAMCRGLDINYYKVAEMMNTHSSAISEEVRKAREIGFQRLKQLISGMLQHDSFMPEAPAMTESELETARIAYKFLPEPCRGILREQLLSGNSVPKIAAELGEDEATVLDMLDSARRLLILRIDIIVPTWLRDQENGEMRIERILRDLREARKDAPEPLFKGEESVFICHRAELVEADNALQLMDDDTLEVFVFEFGAGMEFEKIAEHQNVSVEVVQSRAFEAREMLWHRTRQLLTGMLRIQLEQPNAPRMTDTAFLAAREMFQCVPREYQQAYIQYLVHGDTLEEIAQGWRVSPELTRQRLIEAEQAIATRLISVVGAVIQKNFPEIPTERLPVGYHRFRDFEKAWMPAGPQAAVKPISRIGKIRRFFGTMAATATAWFSQTSTALAQASETVTTHSDRMSWMESVRQGGVPGFFGKLTEVTINWYSQDSLTPFIATATIVSGWLAFIPEAPSMIAIPAWLLLLFCTCFLLSLVRIRTAPSLQARQWMTKQLFYFYSTLVILPIALSFLAWGIIATTEIKNHYFVLIPLLLCYAVANFLLVMIFVLHYPGWFNNTKPPQNRIDRIPMIQTVGWGLVVATVILLTSLGLFAQNTVGVSLGSERMWTDLYRFLWVAATGGGTHVFICYSFWIFVNFSKNEAAFQMYPPKFIAEDSILNKRGIQELANLFIFTLVPVFGNVLNLMFTRNHVTGSVIEMIVYSLCWAVIWRQNTKTTSALSRWARTSIMGIAQLGVFVFLRLVVY